MKVVGAVVKVVGVVVGTVVGIVVVVEGMYLVFGIDLEEEEGIVGLE